MTLVTRLYKRLSTRYCKIIHMRHSVDAKPFTRCSVDLTSVAVRSQAKKANACSCGALGAWQLTTACMHLTRASTLYVTTRESYGYDSLVTTKRKTLSQARVHHAQNCRSRYSRTKFAPPGKESTSLFATCRYSSSRYIRTSLYTKHAKSVMGMEKVSLSVKCRYNRCRYIQYSLYVEVQMGISTQYLCSWRHIEYTLPSCQEYPVPRVTTQKILLPVGIVPETSRSDVRLTNHLASRTGHLVGMTVTTTSSAAVNTRIDFLRKGAARGEFKYKVLKARQLFVLPRAYDYFWLVYCCCCWWCRWWWCDDDDNDNNDASAATHTKKLWNFAPYQIHDWIY